MSKKFEFPTQLLDQINECSAAFFLVTVNEKGEFSVFENTSNPVTHLGMMNFLDIFISRSQNALRDTPNRREESTNEDDDNESGINE